MTPLSADIFLTAYAAHRYRHHAGIRRRQSAAEPRLLPGQPAGDAGRLFAAVTFLPLATVPFMPGITVPMPSARPGGGSSCGRPWPVDASAALLMTTCVASGLHVGRCLGERWQHLAYGDMGVVLLMFAGYGAGILVGAQLQRLLFAETDDRGS
jgi:hypothetical protein